VYFSYWILLCNFDILLAVPRLRRLGAFLSSRMPGFVSRTICFGFVADKWTLEHVCCQYFDFLLSVLFHHCAILLYEGWNFNSGNYLFTTDTK